METRAPAHFPFELNVEVKIFQRQSILIWITVTLVQDERSIRIMLNLHASMRSYHVLKYVFVEVQNLDTK